MALQQNYLQALQSYRKTFALNPNNAKVLVSIGLVLERINQNDKAEQCYYKATQIDASCSEAYQCLGRLK
jgi:Flp pilus assembly protein TadD